MLKQNEGLDFRPRLGLKEKSGGGPGKVNAAWMLRTLGVPRSIEAKNKPDRRILQQETPQNNAVAFILGSAASDTTRALLVKPRKAPAPIIRHSWRDPTV